MNLINAIELYESTSEDKMNLRVVETSLKQIQLGVDYDQIDITYPSATEEVYVYSLASVLVQTIEVDYSDSTKDRPTQVRVS